MYATIKSMFHFYAPQVYDFVFDRLRSVKQDMIIQRVSGMDCVAILERTVRFLIFASYHLCGEPLQLYNPCINDTHLQECLSWLLECYANETEPHPNQEEFQALGLLYNLGWLLYLILLWCIHMHIVVSYEYINSQLMQRLVNNIFFFFLKFLLKEKNLLLLLCRPSQWFLYLSVFCSSYCSGEIMSPEVALTV